MIAPVLMLALAPLLGGDLDERVKAAGNDVDKLWEVRLWLVDQDRGDEAVPILHKILDVDPGNEAAHLALAHKPYDGKWFETYVALSEYRRAEDARMLAEFGKVRHGDGWALEEDIPFLTMGWVRTDDGEWVSRRALDRRAEAERLAAAGYQQQDLTWIPPDEFEQWREGLWKCGEDWLGIAEANGYHSRIGNWWKYPSERFVTWSTCEREGVQWAGWWADRTYADLVRIFGVEPAEKPTLVVLNGLQQYNQLAAGDPDLGLAPTEASGHSSVHYAYFAEAWFDNSVDPPEYQGVGVAWWDRKDPNLAPFGQHSIRHAAAQSYAEAIDPSWRAVGEILANGGQITNLAPFWAEKRIPRWLRYGAASYVERYFVDASDEKDPLWARNWALRNLNDKGGLGNLERVFELTLDPNDVPGSGQLISEAGVVVAFVLDGECEPVIDAHQRFKAALRSGEDTSEAVEELQQALIEHERELAAFARG